MEQRRYKIELTEHQLLLIARCVEDCHRFIAGQTELENTVSCLPRTKELRIRLQDLQPLVTPELDKGASYDWAGNHCPDEQQKKFIAETYYLYRKIYEATTKTRPYDPINVYNSDTLRCKNSGETIKIEFLNQN